MAVTWHFCLGAQDSWHPNSDDGVRSSSSSKSSTVGHTLLAASVSLFAWAFHALDVDVEEILGADCDRQTATMALLQQFLAAQAGGSNGIHVGGGVSSDFRQAWYCNGCIAVNPVGVPCARNSISLELLWKVNQSQNPNMASHLKQSMTMKLPLTQDQSGSYRGICME